MSFSPSVQLEFVNMTLREKYKYFIWFLNKHKFETFVLLKEMHKDNIINERELSKLMYLLLAPWSFSDGQPHTVHGILFINLIYPILVKMEKDNSKLIKK